MPLEFFIHFTYFSFLACEGRKGFFVNLSVIQYILARQDYNQLLRKSFIVYGRESVGTLYLHNNDEMMFCCGTWCVSIVSLSF